MKIKIIHTAALLCMIGSLYGSNDQLLPMHDKKILIDRLITLKAQEYLDLLPAPQQTCELQESEITLLCSRNKKLVNIILSDKTPAEIKHKKMNAALSLIKGGLTKMATLNLIDHNPNARLCYFYSDIVKTTFALIMRAQLGCYTGELMDYEKGYSTPLEKISGEEFVKRLEEAYPEEQQNRLLIRTSNLLVQKTLAVYRQQKAQVKPIITKVETSI